MKKFIALLAVVVMLFSLVIVGCSNNTANNKPAETTKAADTKATDTKATDKEAVKKLGTDFLKAYYGVDPKSMTGLEAKDFVTGKAAEMLSSGAAARVKDYQDRKIETVKVRAVDFRFAYDEKDADGKDVTRYYFNVAFDENVKSLGNDVIITAVKDNSNWKVSEYKITK